VAAGFAATSFGLRDTTLAYGAVIMAVALAAFVGAQAQRRLRRRPCPA
jgi:hypothetical protein